MSNKVISKVLEAEKSADYSEKEARLRANEIIENAKNKAREDYAKGVESAQIESNRRLENARQNGDALILSLEENSKSKLAELDRISSKNKDMAIKAIMDNLI